MRSDTLLKIKVLRYLKIHLKIKAMPFPFLAALPAIASVVGSAVNAWSANRQVKKTNQANMDLAKYQYDMNSPANVMQRYKDAGLNPHLIYGQAGGSGASYQAPRVDYRKPPIDFPNMIAMYQDVQLKQAQIENVAANTSSINARTINEKLRSAVIDAQGKVKLGTMESDILKGKFDSMLSEWKAKGQYNLVNMIQPLQANLMQKQSALVSQELDNKQLDAIYQRYKNQWASMGLREGDHVAMRLVIKMLENAGIPISQWLK